MDISSPAFVVSIVMQSVYQLSAHNLKIEFYVKALNAKYLWIHFVYICFEVMCATFLIITPKFINCHKHFANMANPQPQMH